MVLVAILLSLAAGIIIGVVGVCLYFGKGYLG